MLRPMTFVEGMRSELSVDSQQLAEGIGGMAKRTSKTTIVTVMLFFVGIWIVMAAGITAVWLTEEVRVFGLVMLPTVIVAGLLVVYFDWRAKLRSRTRDERHQYRKAA